MESADQEGDTSESLNQVHADSNPERQADDSRSRYTGIKKPWDTTMPKPIPQANDNSAMVVNEALGSTQGVITAITHCHGGFIQMVEKRRCYLVCECLLGSRLGESISKTGNFNGRA